MENFFDNTTPSSARQRSASLRTAQVSPSAADRLRAASARPVVNERTSRVATSRSRATGTSRRSNVMRYAADSSLVQMIYAVVAGPWRFAFYSIVAFVVVASFYGPARDLYAAYRSGDILTRQLEVRQSYNDQLEDKVDTLLSPEGIEETARKDLGLVMPGEHAVEVIGIDEDSSSDSNEASSTDVDEDNGTQASSSNDTADEQGSSAASSNDAKNDASTSDEATTSQLSATDDTDDASVADESGAASADDAGSSDTADADATDDASADTAVPATSAEAEAAEEAVAADAPWYIRVLDAVFFYGGVDGQTVTSSGDN